MEQYMSISVIIPTYNRGYCISRAMDSILAQSHQPDEIIVVDDGSTDDSEALISTQYPQVRYLKHNNRGVSAARNTGIRASNTEWIALLDSDDAWEPNKIELQMEALATDPDQRICHTNEIWIRNGVRVNPMNKHQKQGGWIFKTCLPLCCISPSSVMIHRDIFDTVGYFDENLPACEDYDLWLRITAKFSVLYLDQCLTIKYGGHDDQLSTQHWGMDRFRITALQHIIKTGDLNTNDKDAAINMLIKKIMVYLKGARKRNKQEDIVYYEKILKQYC